jgi:hypothetical protein
MLLRLGIGLLLAAAVRNPLLAEERPPAAAAAQSSATFARVLQQKAPIPHPESPFVLIFFEGGDDGSRYGFAIDGTMTEQDWAEVLGNVGHLCPYSDFKPGAPGTWSAHRRDVAVRGGQRIGRQTGGSVMGLGDARAAYAEPIALKMTHFFHDEEGDLGTPGGGGGWRLRVDHSAAASPLATAPSPAFDTTANGSLAVFTIEFGFFAQYYLFGGSACLLECRDEAGRAGDGWGVRLVNKGGQKGTTHIVFRSRGMSVESAGLASWQASNWQRAVIDVAAGPTDDQIRVEIEIPGVGRTTGVLPRPVVHRGILQIIAGMPPQADRQTDLDDLRLSSGGRLLASYSFEPASDTARAWGSSAVEVLDASGRGMHLRSTADDQAFQFVTTDGVPPRMLATMKRFLVDDLLEVRREHGVPPPELITNWKLSDRPGRYAAWKPAGFTAGNTDAYLYGDVKPGFANLHQVLGSRAVRWADADGSRWNAVWLGHVNAKRVMTPRQWQSLVTMAVLDGNRWMLLFPAMSGGHFAPTGTTDRAEMARTNAEVLHACAEVAAWFQPVATGLEASEYHDTDYPIDDPRTCVRMRVNRDRGEAWFAAMRVGTGAEPAAVTLHMPRQRGHVTNLATGERSAVEDGVVRLPLEADATPLFFAPD